MVFGRKPVSTAVVLLMPSGKWVGDRLRALPAAVYGPTRHFGASDGVITYDEAPADLVGGLFAQCDAIIGVMAAGIMTRLIAPHLRSKHEDPAIVVVDEAARYAISLVGGHERGANRLSERVASLLGCQAVVTTASEARKDLVVGVGYRRETTAGQLETAVRAAVEQAGAGLDGLRLLGTVDLKKDDAALVEAATRLSVSVAYVTRQTLALYSGDYELSTVARRRIGVDGVCEPAAMLLARRPQLLLKKTVISGVAVAVVREGGLA